MGQMSSAEFYAYLVSKNFVTKEQLGECLKIQQDLRSMGLANRSLLAILIEKKYLSQEQLSQLKHTQKIESSSPLPQIPGYEVKQKLGEGGMGAVYLGRQISMDRPVAIKILAKTLAENKDFVERFHREAKASAALNHRNIVSGIDVGEANGHHYFVMEYIPGKTVDSLMNHGPLTEKKALEIIYSVALALEHAHASHFIHRDIKPENIMISDSGEIKLLDFGLSKQVNNKKHNLTQENSTFGTPYYISPEQASGDEVDIRSDIYSLGATLFHMVTGEPAFDGKTSLVIMTKHLSEIIPDPKELNPDMSGACANLIFRMMEKDPKKRFQTPRELLDSIDAIRRHAPTIAFFQAEGNEEEYEQDEEDEESNPTKITSSTRKSDLRPSIRESAVRTGVGLTKKRTKTSSGAKNLAVSISVLGVLLILFLWGTFFSNPKNENTDISSLDPETSPIVIENENETPEKKEFVSSDQENALALLELSQFQQKRVLDFSLEQATSQVALLSEIDEFILRFPQQKELFEDEAKQILARLETLGKEQFQALETQSQQHWNKSEVSQALVVWETFPEVLKPTDFFLQAKERKKQLLLKYEQDFQNQLTQYRRLYEEQQYNKADEMQQTLESFCLPQDLPEIQSITQYYKKKRDALLAEQAQQEQVTYLEYAQKEILPLYFSRQEAQLQFARQKLQEAETLYPGATSTIQADRELLNFLTHSETRLEKLIQANKKIKIAKKTIYSSKIRLEELTNTELEDLFRLIEQEEETPLKPETFLWEKIVYSFFRRYYEDSWLLLQQVRKEDQEKYNRFCLEVQQKGKAAREQRAEALFTEAEGLMDKSRTSQLEGKKILQHLLDSYPETLFVQTHRPDIESLLTTQKKAPTNSKDQKMINLLSKKIHGKISVLSRNLFRIEYDFSTPQQFEDFEPDNLQLYNPGRPYLRDFVKHPAGGVYGSNETIWLWKPKLEGPVSIEVSGYPIVTDNLGVAIHYASKWEGYFAFFNLKMYQEFLGWGAESTLFESEGLRRRRRGEGLNNIAAKENPFADFKNMDLTETENDREKNKLISLKLALTKDGLFFYVGTGPTLSAQPYLSGNPTFNLNQGQVGVTSAMGAVFTQIVIIGSFEKEWFNEALKGD